MAFSLWRSLVLVSLLDADMELWVLRILLGLYALSYAWGIMVLVADDLDERGLLQDPKESDSIE